LDERAAPEAPIDAATSSAPADDGELEAADSEHRDRAGPAAPMKLSAGTKLHIVRLFAPESVQNGSQDVTIGE
jgi:hypothetical protein